MDNINKKENWQIYVMFHKVLLKENYICDKNFNFKNFTFIKGNEKFKASYDKDFFTKILYENNLKNYNPELQMKKYFAPSIIYHIYKNNIYETYDYIGFIEYDIPLIPPPNSNWKSFSDEINKIVSSNEGGDNSAF